MLASVRRSVLPNGSFLQGRRRAGARRLRGGFLVLGTGTQVLSVGHSLGDGCCLRPRHGFGQRVGLALDVLPQAQGEAASDQHHQARRQAQPAWAGASAAMVPCHCRMGAGADACVQLGRGRGGGRGAQRVQHLLLEASLVLLRAHVPPSPWRSRASA